MTNGARGKRAALGAKRAASPAKRKAALRVKKRRAPPRAKKPLTTARKRAPVKRRAAVVAKKRVYDGFFKIDELTVSHTRYDGAMAQNVKRLVFERGDSAAALIHDVERDVIVLTEQFRVPTYEKGPGWLIEAVAGSIDAGETPAACIRREIREEIGYQVKKVTPIGHFYVSPGGTSERIFLFYAAVKRRQLVDANARGLASEHEDIERIELPLKQFWRRLKKGAFEDGKLLVAGWWLRARV